MRVPFIGADDDPSPVVHGLSALVVTPDPHHRAVLDEELLHREPLPDLGPGTCRGIDEDLSRIVRRGAYAADIPSCGHGVPTIVKGPKSNE